jgi:hypothetical protein
MTIISSISDMAGWFVLLSVVMVLFLVWISIKGSRDINKLESAAELIREAEEAKHVDRWLTLSGKKMLQRLEEARKSGIQRDELEELLSKIIPGRNDEPEVETGGDDYDFPGGDEFEFDMGSSSEDEDEDTNEGDIFDIDMEVHND